MQLYNKLVLYLKEKIFPNCSRKNKYFCFFVILLSFIFFLFVISFNVDKRDFFQKNEITFRNVFNNKKIEKIINDDDDSKKRDNKFSEQDLIGFKAMLLGINIFAVFFGLKKGLIGVSLGIFIGAVLGIWLFIFCPSIIYFLELIYKEIANLKLFKK